MSQAHIEQFYGKAAKDPALVQKMLAGTSGPDDFVRAAVKEGKAHGFDFTFEEANAWIKKQQEIKASGELSDSQLETVAGGKSAKQTAQQASDAVFGNKESWKPMGNMLESGYKKVSNTVSNWFMSW